jgi:hypothetical protein
MDESGPLLLLESDGVPGAILVPINPHRYSKNQLEQWLRCRGLPVSGTKDQLVERSVPCLHSLGAFSGFLFFMYVTWSSFRCRFLKRSANKALCKVLDPGFDGGKWLEAKRRRILDSGGPSVRTSLQRCILMYCIVSIITVIIFCCCLGASEAYFASHRMDVLSWK